MYALAALCWLPVVWLQIQMHNMLKAADKASTELPMRFWRYASYWELLGYPAFIAIGVIYWLMVAKPV